MKALSIAAQQGDRYTGPDEGLDLFNFFTLTFSPSPRPHPHYSLNPCPHPAADWTAWGPSLQICLRRPLAAAAGWSRRGCWVAVRYGGKSPPAAAVPTLPPPAGRGGGADAAAGRQCCTPAAVTAPTRGAGSPTRRRGTVASRPPAAPRHGDNAPARGTGADY